MLVGDSFTSSANGACGRQARQESAGMRPVPTGPGERHPAITAVGARRRTYQPFPLKRLPSFMHVIASSKTFNHQEGADERVQLASPDTLSAVR
jgi:hypothetical protein